MPINVNDAFRLFLNEKIAITKSQKEIAEKSKDNLLEQINHLSDEGVIPHLCKSKHLLFGSFYRKTKNAPLDDIDLIVCYDARGCVSIVENSWDDIKLVVSDNGDDKLINLSDKKSKSYYSFETEYELNSNKIKNNLLSSLSKVSDYKKAELHGRGEAVTLSLKSYDWTFDIVPAFYYEDGNDIIYVIPNGNGKWKKTNPIKEKDRIRATDNLFKQVASKVVRLIKHWNKHGKMPTMTSYVLETAVLDFFDTLMIPGENETVYPDLLFRDALKYIRDHIFSPIYDSKGIEGDINTLSYSDRYKIWNRSKNDYEKACDAVKAELEEKDCKKSINIWRDIFGDCFPKYE